MLTNTVSTPSYPTEWHPIDVINNTECRQLDEDTYQIRTTYVILTLKKEGFDVFRGEDHETFLKWMADNNVEPIPRSELDHS